MEIIEIVKKLRQETDIPPRNLVQMHSELSAEYYFLATKLDVILTQKPAAWLLLRDESKSATEAERKWEATPAGIEEGKLRRQLKVVEKLLSSLRQRLEIKNQEARNVM